ncbi:hypothetical protein Tsubulata_006608 [Turnera subulata]|uniref:ATP-dependent Clp protease proteolytic subunit n=1 Tax=Turnera subulata TaxID=218843 RepID=A0A9Q0FFK3_9ROSI|nr:hypothetical protein Tsubulata_006608 [Turnera subulata]
MDLQQPMLDEFRVQVLRLTEANLGFQVLRLNEANLGFQVGDDAKSERHIYNVLQVEKDVAKDRYMSALEALEFGLIDEVIDRVSIIPLPPLPAKVTSTLKVPMKFMTPDIPEDEIY